MAARVAAEAGTASFPVGLVARADAVTAAEDRFFGGTAGLGFGGGGPHTSGSASSAESPKARAITSLDGVGGRPIATASSCARLTSISCSQGMSRPLKAGTAGGSGPGTGAAGSRFSLVGWRPEETGAGAGTGAAGSPHWRRWRATGAGAGSGWTGAGPSCTCHHAGSEASVSGGGRGSLSSPRTGGSAEVARSARSAALRCARSSVARSSACLRFCAQSAAALDAFDEREDGRRALQRRVRVGRSERRHASSGVRGGDDRERHRDAHDGRARGRARRPDDHEARRGTVRHLERVT